MRISGAKAIIQCLLERGVDTVFGYPGGSVLPLYDALLDSPLRHVLTVHEQGAAHAADGYARASGRVGVCIATSGPGATNLVTGLAAAYLDSVPVLAITGQVPTTLIGRDAFQEVDITGITLPVTKHNFLVKHADKLVEVMRLALRIACLGRPGPVLVDVPRDVQTALVEYRPLPPGNQEKGEPSAGAIRLAHEAAAAISAAKRPVLVVGGGVVAADAYNEIRSLAEKCFIPVVSTLMGLGAFPGSHPQYLGMTGLHGLRPANNAVHAADTIIAVGSRFSDRLTGNRERYADNKTIIQLDIDPAEIDKNVAVSIGLTGDLKQLLQIITERVQPGSIEEWWNTIRTWQNEAPAKDNTEKLTGTWIMKHIAAQTAGRPYIFATDVGQHQMWAAQHLSINEPRTWLTSGGLGAMGFGLPAALGAQLAVPGKRVIHIAGDGGFKMTGNELYTVARLGLPIISVIINNHGLGMIRQLQQVFFEQRYSACDLPHPVDYVAFAAAFGVKAVTVDTKDEFAAAFAAAQAANQPQVIIANISSEDMVTPMVQPGAALNDYIRFNAASG